MSSEIIWHPRGVADGDCKMEILQLIQNQADGQKQCRKSNLRSDFKHVVLTGR